MEIQRSTVKFVKRIVVLEAQCDQLKEEKCKLKKRVMELEGKEKEMIEKYVKLKDKYAKAKEEFNSKGCKWRDKEESLREKCRLEGVEKRKLEIDLKAAKRRITNGSVEVTQKFMAMGKHFQSLLEECNGRITTLLAKNEALDRDSSRLVIDFEAQVAMEASKKTVEVEKKVLELDEKIQLLETEKREIEAKFFLVSKEKSEGIKRISNEKTAAEAEKKALELAQRIEVLVWEKRELETEVCREKRERSEEIKKVLNEKNVLEREKQELDVETREKDERIKVLEQEKERLAIEKKEIEANWSVVKSRDDVELPHRVHPARNACISSTLAAQNRGPKSVDVSVTGPIVSLVGGSQLRELLGPQCQKRKVEGLGSFVVKRVGTKRRKLDGLVEYKLRFRNHRDMFNAVTTNDELCMRSVCALYRKYKSLGVWKDSSASTIGKGFVQPYEIRGMVLGELLTSGDPEGSLKMSLAEFEQADSSGLQDCRQIAWNHYKELFEIHKNKLDPLFKPAGEMN